jgi:hypothetical protein
MKILCQGNFHRCFLGKYIIAQAERDYATEGIHDWSVEGIWMSFSRFVAENKKVFIGAVEVSEDIGASRG